MAIDRLYLSNDSTVSNQPGYNNADDIGTVDIVVLPTVGGASGVLNTYYVGPMPDAGRVTNFQIATFRPAISASGFVSGALAAALRINSGLILSTNPQINQLTTSVAITNPYVTDGTGPSGATSAGLMVSGVVNNASAFFNKGDIISYDFSVYSAASGAAGAVPSGLFAKLQVRYNAY